jgi:hypothetical protein
MIVDDRVEPLVRRILGTVVKRNDDGFEAALRVLSDEDTRRKALELAVAICAFALLDAYGELPTSDDVELLAQQVAEMEEWSSLQPGEISAFLMAILEHRPLTDVLDPETAFFAAFIVTGSLLAASPRIGEGEWWFNYLDRVEAIIEATPSR